MIQFKKLQMIKYINQDNQIISLRDCNKKDIVLINEFLKNNEIKNIICFKGVLK